MGRAAKIAGAVAGLAALGEAGHLVLERLGWQVAHHVFHVGYLGAALAAFARVVVRDLRERARPRDPRSAAPGARPPDLPAGRILGIVGPWTGGRPGCSPR